MSGADVWSAKQKLRKTSEGGGNQTPPPPPASRTSEG